MTNELSIKGIKKEIIDKLMNNMDVLNYFKKYTAEGFTISKLYNNFIFDYDSSSVPEDYITVEVSEFDSKVNATDKKYQVVIKMGLEKEENICDMASKIVEIIEELYPGKKRFSNVPFKTMDNCISVDGYSGYTPMSLNVYMENKRYNQLHRMITFEIG